MISQYSDSQTDGEGKQCENKVTSDPPSKLDRIEQGLLSMFVHEAHRLQAHSRGR